MLLGSHTAGSIGILGEGLGVTLVWIGTNTCISLVGLTGRCSARELSRPDVGDRGLGVHGGLAIVLYSFIDSALSSSAFH